MRGNRPRWYPLALGLALLSAPLAPERAQADPGAAAAERDSIQVAVLPFAASEPRMEMYGRPIADAVTRALTHGLAEVAATGGPIEVRVVSLTGAVPKRVDLVVDGRIVSGMSGALSLEAGVRDPERGRRLGAVAGQPGKLTDVDRLAQSLGQRLVPGIERAAARLRDARKPGGKAAGSGGRAEVARTPRSGAHGTPVLEQVGDSAPSGQVVDDRPILLVFAQGRAAGGAVAIDDLSAQAIEQLADQLGYRPVLASGGSPEQMVVDMRARGAAKGLLLDVRDVVFAWRGVLIARGRFQARLLDPSGLTLYAGTRVTDSLVGNRGDGHRAVARRVLEQMVDILRAELRAHANDRRPAAGERSAS